MIGKNKSVTKRVSLNGRLVIRKSEKYFPLINKNMQILYGYIIFLKSLQSYLYAYKIFIHITVWELFTWFIWIYFTVFLV